MDRPKLVITQEMLDLTATLEASIRIKRTRTSKCDSVGGAVGEFIFSEWFTGDWRNHEVGSNKGQADYKGIVEVKASIFPFSERLNLVVREDYLPKRRALYVQIILSVSSRTDKQLVPGTEAIICGFATPEMFDGVKPAPMQMGAFATSYNVYAIPITKLKPMTEFTEAFRIFSAT